jgi:hypothetical protein
MILASFSATLFSQLCTVAQQGCCVVIFSVLSFVGVVVNGVQMKMGDV